MSGDYTRFTFDPRNRYSGVLMQQGRVQLDSDWNEEIDILRRRIRTTTLDILGPIGVPYVASPDAFKIGLLPGSPADLSIGPGRLYVEGIQVEAFAEENATENATYNDQPFFPAPPLLPVFAGGAVVYLDVWDREVTYIEDPDLLDVALGGADTTTRRQTVWQVRVAPVVKAACGVSVGDPPSAGRLTSRAIAPPAPDDPCILPPASGYRGLENRLYRVEIHNGGALGTARFKWSRDNASIVSVVRAIAVSGSQTTLTVNRIGRDQFLRFRVGDWVAVTDDHRELMGETGEMALIVNIDETNRQIVVDRALPTGTGLAFGATATAIAERHTRVQRWDQTGATNVVDGDGLVLTDAGPIAIEDGIDVQFSTDPGGSFRVGDYWVFWARTATAEIEELTNAPPRGITHHYVQLAAITGLGGAADPVVTDCRPPPPQQGAGDCCCTIVVPPGEDIIQKAIDALPPQGGCVCLKTGVHTILRPLLIARGSITLEAESPGTTVRNLESGPALIIIGDGRSRVEGIDVLGIDFETNKVDDRLDAAVVSITGAVRVRISHCGMSAGEGSALMGIHATLTDQLSVHSCRLRRLIGGVWVDTGCAGFEADSNVIEIESRERRLTFGIAYMQSAFACRVTRNAISGAEFGILINDNPFKSDLSRADGSIVERNFVDCPDVTEGPNEAVRPVAIDVAARHCTISANRIRYNSRSYIGIRVTGWGCEISDNHIASRRQKGDTLGPVAIAIGVGQGDNKAPVVVGIVAHNTIVGAQNGVVCADASNLVVEGNVIETPGGLAIVGERVSASQFSGNHIRDMASAILLNGGVQNCISGNDCRNGGAGISLFSQTGPRITGNRLDSLKLWGVFGREIFARFDIVENRVVHCGSAMPNFAFAVGCFVVFGEAHIANNEIMDTGSGGDQASPVDYGIYGDLIWEARVSGNLVTYSNAGTRSTQREDRALIMRGFSEFSLDDNEATSGFAAQIDGNKFIGTGRSALVELRETRLSSIFVVRFERVSFGQNYCMHATPSTPQDRANDATVRLVGHRAIVMGNHIKAATRDWPSVNFSKMEGPFIGNVIAGRAINHPDFPATELLFNLIAP